MDIGDRITLACQVVMDTDDTFTKGCSKWMSREGDFIDDIWILLSSWIKVFRIANGMNARQVDPSDIFGLALDPRPVNPD